MNPNTKQTSMQVYAASQEQYKTPPNENQMDTGVAPLDTLPAGWWNWLWEQITKNNNNALLSITDLRTELLNVLSDANIPPSALDATQLLQAINVIRKRVPTTDPVSHDPIPGSVISSAARNSVSVDGSTGQMIVNALSDWTSNDSVKTVIKTPPTTDPVSHDPIPGAVISSAARSGVSVDSNTGAMTVNALSDWTSNSTVTEVLEDLDVGVTGVKGSAESDYRQGNVNITKANIGLGNVVDTGDSTVPEENGAKKFTSGGAYDFFGGNTNAQSWLGRVFSWALGKNWTQGTGGIANVSILKKAYYANGIWVTGTDGLGLWWSTDGKVWTQGTGDNTSFRFYSVYYANGIWVAGSDSNGLWWSTDGKAWTKGTGGNTSNTSYFVYYANGKWIACGRGLWWSTDGKAWTIAGGNVNSRESLYAYYANGIWVTGTDSNGLWWSTNGTSWTKGTGSNTNYTFESIYYANGIWVAGSDSNGLWWSTDGKAWTKGTGGNSSYSFRYCLYYANGIWVAGSRGQGLWWSTNGKAWTQSGNTSGLFDSIYYANGLWVAAGQGLWWSTDGKAWIQAKGSYFYSVYYANGIWVAGSDSNGLWWSGYDNIEWQ